jgi:CheY-like chemotaxis protein
MKSAAPLAPPRILVADDNRDAAQTLGAMLEMALHCKVDLAYEGVQTIEMARHHRPDLAFLDISMPRKTGLEAAVELRRAYPADTPMLVALTAQDDEALRVALVKADFDRRFTKPADPRELISAAAEDPARRRQLPSVRSRRAA